MVAGSLTYDTNLKSDGFEKGLGKLKSTTIAVGNIMAKALEKAASLAISVGKSLVKLGKQSLELYADFEQLEGRSKKTLWR